MKTKEITHKLFDAMQKLSDGEIDLIAANKISKEAGKEFKQLRSELKELKAKIKK